LQASNKELKTAAFLLDLLTKKSVVYLSEITAKLNSVTDYRNSDFARAFFQILSDKKMLAIKGGKDNPAYQLNTTYEIAFDIAKETYNESENNTLPEDTQIYYKMYGFDKLVASVSKWVNYKDVIEREYSIDRLWLMRYIDFLDKAKEWVIWLKADQALVKKQIDEMKKAVKKNK